eukprot:gi/632970770/ref/XP_007901832.1/ PREDICTED: rab11 family-interacting protein 2 [Callorhinchus milii]
MTVRTLGLNHILIYLEFAVLFYFIAILPFPTIFAVGRGLKKPQCGFLPLIFLTEISCASIGCCVRCSGNNKFDRLQINWLFFAESHPRIVRLTLDQTILHSNPRGPIWAFIFLRWFKLESKPGKKSKERGELQVSIQFMRNNMTASMFDLSMKDKTRSPFAKFKDKMKGRKNDSTISDHSSAIVPSTASNSDQDALEVDKQQKSKPKKTFLLGPQRLSSAQSMSDLTGPRQSLEKMKSNTVGHVVCKSHSDSANSNEEMGLVYMSQKAATLPRSKNPFENSSDSWKTRGDASSETPNDGQSETKKEAKKDKEKEKMSLFARVTGKKDAKKSEKVIARSDGFGDPLNPFTKDLQASFEFDSRNPFSANYNAVANSSSLKSPMTDDLKIVETSSHDKLNYQKINQHLSKGFKQHHFEYHGDKSRVNDPNLFATGYRNLSNNELICELLKHKELIKRKDGQIRELEDYIDNLLVRVMEETPSILRVPYEPSRRAGKLPKKN